MTILTYIPNIHAYRLEEEHLAIGIEQMMYMYPSALASFLGCSQENAEDIQDALRDECPTQIHIVDDSVYYIYKWGTF